jgi:hypothetical protein
MTDLLFGAADQYRWEQIKPWAQSIRESGFDGDVILLVYRGDRERIATEAEKFGVEAFSVDHDNIGRPIEHATRGRDTQCHQMRFFHLWQYLTFTRPEPYRFVITTDVRDVIFQRNPVEWLEQNLQPVASQIVAPSENISYEHEPWGADNMQNGFGAIVWEKAKGYTITNVGTIAGHGEAIRDLSLILWSMGENRFIPNDQSSWNLLAHSSLLDIVWAPFSSGWAFQAGTTIDPEKIEMYKEHWVEESFGYTSLDGYVYCGDEKFYLVHQYDRVPGLREKILERYGVKETY